MLRLVTLPVPPFAGAFYWREISGAEAAELIRRHSTVVSHVQHASTADVLSALSGRDIADCEGRLMPFVPQPAEGDEYLFVRLNRAAKKAKRPADEIGLPDLQFLHGTFGRSPGRPSILPTRAEAEAAIEAAGGNRTAAAKALGISRTSLYTALGER